MHVWVEGNRHAHFALRPYSVSLPDAPLDRLLRSVTEDCRSLRARGFAVVEMQ